MSFGQSGPLMTGNNSLNGLKYAKDFLIDLKKNNKKIKKQEDNIKNKFI